MINTKRTLTAATLVLCLLMPAVANAVSFKDMPDSMHWAYPGLKYATDKGYVTGYEDNTLRISNSITRAESASMLNRMIKKTAPRKANPFKDMSTSNWFYKDMMNLYSLGYISGTSSTTISPNKTITREEAFTILARIAKNKGIEGKGSLRFKDEETVALWAKDPIRYLADAGIISGTNGKVYPKNPISRAEFATILYKLDTAAKEAQRKKVEEWNREKDRQFYEDYDRRMREFEARKKAREEKNNGLYPSRPNTPDMPAKSRDERPSDNPKGYEVARVREATTPVPGPAIPAHYRVEATRHIDGRTYYGVRLDNVDAYIIQEVNRIRMEHGLKPLKVLANWDEKSYLRATEANMAMRDCDLSDSKREEDFNINHKRPDGSRYSTLFNTLYIPDELGQKYTTSPTENLHWIGTSDGSTAQDIAKRIVNDYMNSEGHRRNILNPRHDFINSGTTLRTLENGQIDKSLYSNITNCINFG